MERISSRASKLFRKVESQLGKYDHLQREIKDGKLNLTGSLDIGYGSKNTFDIEIIVSDKYPNKIPEVHETSGRVPSVMDRHYMSDDTGCCLVMPHRYTEYFKPLMIFEEFIDVLVVPFFQNQIYYEINGKFVTGYRHGEHGIWEHYVEVFGEDLTLDTLLLLLEAVLDQRLKRMNKIKGHKPCPCGSGRIQRYCHGKGLIQLKQHGSTSILITSLNYLYIKGLYKRIVRNEIVESVNYELKLQTIDITKLPKLPVGGAAVYDLKPPVTGAYQLKIPEIIEDSPTQTDDKNSDKHVELG
jgi:hypothetical protein